jgi:predicted small lipoprotein YifL
MKKVLGIMAVVAISALTLASCGKKCNCTYYEDGKKVSVSTYDDGATRFFQNSVCKDMSVEKHRGYSIVTEDKEVDVEVVCK